MKIKFVKDRFGYKAGDTADVADTDAKSFVDEKYAEAVDEKADAEAVITAAFEKQRKQIKDEVESLLADHTAKVAKGLSKASSRIVVGPDSIEKDPQGGFKSYGDFAGEVIQWSRGNRSERMTNYVKSTTGNTEGAAPDAGPTVPVQYTRDIFKVTGDLQDYFGMTFQVPMQTNSIKIPVLKNYNHANATVTAGVVAAVVSEVNAITQSKSNWEQLSLTLGKIGILVPVSNELIEDNIVALDSVLTEHSQYQIRKAMNGGILAGLSGAFTGIIGNTATKDTTTTTTLASGTGVAAADVLNIYANFAHGDADYGSAVWFAHPTVIPKLGAITVGNFPMYFAPGQIGSSSQAYGSLLGRPLIVSEFCNAVNTSGDIVLADLKKYVTGFKGGLQSAQSMHLFFNTDESAFRYTMRVNGKPGLSGKITLFDGSTTVSPFVTLATRT